MAIPTNAEPQDDLSIGILGPLEVHRGGSRCALGGRQQRSVLALLVLAAGRVVSLDRIADALWGDDLPASYVTTVQTYVFRLRMILEPERARGEPARILESTPGGGYRLDLPPTAVDAVRFESGVARGRAALEAGDASAAAKTLSEALGLWRGEVLSDLGDLEPGRQAAQRLGEERAAAIEDWATAELAMGHHAALAPQLAAFESAHPFRERLAALRMVALYRSGRQGDALNVYREVSHRLDEELGVRPGEELRSLHERILRQDPDLARSPQAERSNPPTRTPRRDGSSTHALPTAAAGAASTPHPVRRRRVALAVATVAVVASLLLSVAITRAGARPVPANSAAVVGPSGLVGEAVTIGAVPIGIAADAGSIWVLDHTNAAVERVDPDTRQVIRSIPDVGSDPQAISARDGDVWVAAFGSRVITRIDAEADEIVGRIEVGNHPAAVIAGDTGVWVANSGDNTVQRIDANTGKTDTAITVGDGPSALALEGSTLWVANARSGTITELDTRTREPQHADIVVDAGPSAIAVTESDVWVANQLGRTVSRIDRVTRQVARIFVDDGPSSIVIRGNEVWVGHAFAGTLSRIDTRSNSVTNVAVGSTTRALALVGDDVWTASGAFNDLEHVGGTLTVEEDFAFDAADVDPTSEYNPPVISMLRPVYDGLVAFSRPGGLSGQTIVPDLATAVPQPSEGGRTYVFTIRRGIHYSDGRELKATDFVRGFRRTFVRHPEMGLFDAIVGAKECARDVARSLPVMCDLGQGVTADDDTMRLTIHLTEPDPELVYKLAYVVAPAPPGTPLDPVVAPRWIPSTGPYTVGSLDQDGTLTLVRNPYFSSWSHAAQPAGYPDVIVHRFAESKERATDDVLAGRADLAPVPYEQHNLALSHPGQVLEFSDASTDFLYVNTYVAPFDNLLVRQALNYAVDRREFVSLYAGGRALARPSCQMLPPDFPSYAPYCPYQTGPPDQAYLGPDLDTARRLVARSGTEGTRVTIHRRVEGEGHNQNVWWPFPDYIARVLRDLGYQATVEDIPQEHRPYSTTDPAYEGYQLFTQFGWLADYDSPATFYDRVASCRLLNLTRYCNEAIDAVARKAVAMETADPGAAVALWSQVDRMLVDDGAFVTLGNRVNLQVVASRVGNYQARATYGPVLSQLWVT